MSLNYRDTGLLPLSSARSGYRMVRYGRIGCLRCGRSFGDSGQQFRCCRGRYEGELEGLIERRGSVSAKRVPVVEIDWMLGGYQTRHLGWNVKHCHKHLHAWHGFRRGYT